MRTSRSAAPPAVLTAICLTALLAAGCGAPVAPDPAAGPTGSTAPAPPSATAPPSVTATATAAPIARSVPVRLSIPAIGVDTPLMRLGLASDGTVEVPPVRAHAPAGWYSGSPTPGRTGPSVILGHVTVGRYGDGVFLRLSRLRPGARVVVRLKDGLSVAFTVDAVRTVAKDRFPTQEVYGDTDDPELRLITCGGPRTGDGYLDNVVVFASAAPSAPTA
ncbi:class F sortase [Actinacidiphila yeochonensis]|uniref:class F sortase n=1 Tax=Actinacidiphila yeochonensis TaxID=89050 RepID=UPI00056C8420|nr:class F sortase [Actinacidiphila yeochonensis]